MPLPTASLKAQYDLPVVESELNQPPVATSALSCTCTSEDGSDEFIYYLTGSTFYRYSTKTDTWQLLSAPVVAPVTLCSMRYTKYRGYHGRIISATAGTVRLPGMRGPILNGKNIEIDGGTGKGQVRTLTYTGETIHDAGVITGTATNYLQDTLKKWDFNQWAGYTVGIVFGTGNTVYKKILYNDNNTLYVSDVNLMPQEPWNNQAYVANLPYALPVTTAGSQAHYQILSSDYTVNSNWTVTPDNTSMFRCPTGGIFLLSSAAAAPFVTLQYYDVLMDNWIQKTVPQSLILAAFGTDSTLERMATQATPFANGTATSGAARLLTDTSKTWVVDNLKNFRIFITGGTGVGQNRRIVCNGTNYVEVASPWVTNPDATSTYEVQGDNRKLWVGGGAAAALFAYNIEFDQWEQGESFDWSVISNISCKFGDYLPFGVSSGTRIAAGVTGIASAPTAGGTNYVIGDILTCSVGGTGAKVIVTSIAPGGVVTGLALVASGTVTGFTVATGQATTGGSGSGCTINVISVGATATITLPTASWIKRGHIVKFAGCNSGGWNANYMVLGVSALTTSTTVFDVATSEAASMAATAAQGTTTIVDPTKNWTVNEHAGRLVSLTVAGLNPTTQIRWIVSNTATALTVATIVAGVVGTSRYNIYDSKIFGVDCENKADNRRGYGHATGGSTTTLVDNTKVWVPNEWAGYKINIEAGTGLGNRLISIVSNTETTITYATQSFTPDATTHYEIMATWGLMTAGSASAITETTTKNWDVNRWAGKRVRVTGGTALGQEVAITSNTATALSATLTAPDVTSTYAILGIPARGAGTELMWLSGAAMFGQKGRAMMYPRGGGSNTCDIYDLVTGRWVYGHFFSPQAELPQAGSDFAYDGANTIYFSRSVASTPIRIFKFDITTNVVSPALQTAHWQGTVHIGNLMDIVKTSQGDLFLYILQNTGTVFARALLF